MINVNSVAHGVVNAIRAHPMIQDSGYDVDLGVAIGRGTDRPWWIGVWPGGMTVDPLMVGGSRPWMADVEIDVIHMVTWPGGIPGEALGILLEAQNAICAAVNSNKQLDGTVQIIRGLVTEPFERDTDEDEYALVNVISLTYEVRG